MMSVVTKQIKREIDDVILSWANIAASPPTGRLERMFLMHIKALCEENEELEQRITALETALKEAGKE